MRETIERPEVVEAGFGRLAGSNYASNVAGVRALTAGASAQLLSENYPFGDGSIAPGVDQGASLKEIAA
jgi:UDP-N-acetylglucosamine 2-epimerase